MGNSKASCTVLVVDDDQQVLHQLTDLLQPTFKVLSTRDQHRAVEWLQKDISIGIIIVEQILRGGLGMEILETAQKLRPEIRRVLITRYCDLSSIVQGLHNGAVHRTISKPILHAELSSAIGLPFAVRASV